MLIKIKSSSKEASLSKDPYDLLKYSEQEDQATSWYEPEPLSVEGFKGIPPSLEPDYQASAVEAQGSVMLIAPPGSGKTRVAQAKAVQLHNDKVPFVALMFTVKAAEELRDRLSTNGQELKHRVGTIHSFCLRELRRVYPTYRLSSFGNLLSHFLELETKPLFPHVIVDEMQDLSEIELKVLESIRGEYIFGVGDPYQSIYGFAGALGEEAFEYFPAKRMELKYNYRSTQDVIDYYESVCTRGVESRGNGNLDNAAILTRTNRIADEAFRNLKSIGVSCTRVLPGTKDKGDLVSKGNGNVYVMTIHCSKATEYGESWLLGLNPSMSLYEHDSEVHVEYVGLSRGMVDTGHLAFLTDFADYWLEEHNEDKVNALS